MNLNAHILKNVARVRSYAEAHPISFEDVVVRGFGPPQKSISEDPKCTCAIDDEINCCFTIEEQPMGAWRHLSINIASDNPIKRPSDHEIQSLMWHFGFEGGLESLLLDWVEDHDWGISLNLIQIKNENN